MTDPHIQAQGVAHRIIELLERDGCAFMCIGEQKVHPVPGNPDNARYALYMIKNGIEFSIEISNWGPSDADVSLPMSEV